MDIFAKKFLWLGACNGNIRKSQIMVKDKTETCQKQEMHFLCASDCADMYDVRDVQPKGYDFCRKSSVFLL